MGGGSDLRKGRQRSAPTFSRRTARMPCGQGRQEKPQTIANCITGVRPFASPRGKRQYWDSNFGKNHTNTKTRMPGRAGYTGLGKGRQRSDTNTNSGRRSTTSRAGGRAYRATNGQNAMSGGQSLPCRAASPDDRTSLPEARQNVLRWVPRVRPLACRSNWRQRVLIARAHIRASTAAVLGSCKFSKVASRG
jgi:hypothetical protein